VKSYFAFVFEPAVFEVNKAFWVVVVLRGLLGYDAGIRSRGADCQSCTPEESDDRVVGSATSLRTAGKFVLMSDTIGALATTNGIVL